MKQNNLIKIYLTIAAFLLASLTLLVFCTDTLQPFTCNPARSSLAPAIADEAVFDSPQKRVVLDAGHGGEDPGAQSPDGIQEKDLNLALATKTAQFLSLFQIDTTLTRNADILPQSEKRTSLSRKQSEMLAREEIARSNDPDLFLSIHMNSYPGALCRGAQVFYTEQNPQNEVFASFLQNSVEDLLQTDNTRTIKPTSQIYLLNRLTMPAALIECGFLSTPDEVERFTDEEYQSRFSFLLAASIAAYLYRT